MNNILLFTFEINGLEKMHNFTAAIKSLQLQHIDFLKIIGGI